MKVWLSLILRGGLNAREHWAQRARRVKTERNVVALAFAVTRAVEL